MNNSAIDLRSIRNEFVASGNGLIPYDYHYSEFSIKTENDSLLRVYEVSGILFETADNEEINAWQEQLSTALLSINNASDKVAIWHWLIKEPDSCQRESTFSQPFAADFLQSYADQLNKTAFHTTRQFIAVLVKSPFKVSSRGKGKISSRRQAALKETEETLDEITSELMTLQHRIHPLKVYQEGKRLYSAPLEVLFRVLNGYWEQVPLLTAPIKNWLQTSRFLAALDAFEIRTIDDKIHGACLGLRQYMNPTDPLMLQNILRLPFPITLCQSFTFLDNSKTMSELNRQYGQLRLSKSAPQAVIDGMASAIDSLKSNRICFGEFHFSLFVYVYDNEADDPLVLRKKLTDRVSQAKQVISQSSAIPTRDDRTLPSCYYAQLPGNFEYRPRYAKITNKNFAAFMPLYTTPTGTDHSWWKNRDNEDEELLGFKSSSGGLYRFNLHVGEIGHTLIIGTSGSGKTVLMGALTTQFDKYGARVILFDKDFGQEILFKAMGGSYTTIPKGKPSGLNPYQMEGTPENINFLTDFTLKLAYPDDSFTSTTENELSEHLRNWYANKDLPKSLRRLSELVKGLQSPDLKSRLQKWTKTGAWGWLFDNETDTLDFHSSNFIGIDTTDILDEPVAKVPFFMYLTHRVTESLDGSRTVLALDEMWKMLDDPYFETMIKDWLKTLRKKNALLIGATQDASDIASSNISSTLLTQCLTSVFYANSKANWEDYSVFALTKSEFDFIKNANPKQRMLLIKQENSSVIVNFALQNMDRLLAVISGRTANIEIANQCIEEAGPEPKDWLPLYYQRYVTE